MRTGGRRLRKVAKWLLIANGVLWPLLILVLILAPDETDPPPEVSSDSKWVLPLRGSRPEGIRVAQAR